MSQDFVKEIKKIRQRERLKTKIGRAFNILNAYKKSDEMYGRGETNLTAEWIVDNIFSKPCVHCGETDWHKLGCNRLDNTKPHTKDNVEPCCRSCNSKLRGEDLAKELSIPVYQYTLDNKFVKKWKSANEIARETNFDQSSIFRCCHGGFYRKGKWVNTTQHQGYRWSYEPL